MNKTGQFVWVCVLICLAFVSQADSDSNQVKTNNRINHNWSELTQEQYVDNLVKCKITLDELKWSYNLWPKENKSPKPLFSEVVDIDEIRQSVLENLKMEAVLAKRFNFEITPVMLQHDLDRMAKNTKDPKRLKELFAVLNNNPITIAQCVSRPYLVQKKTANSYNWHNEIHSETKALAEAEIGIFKKTRNADFLSVELQTITFSLKTDDKDELEKSLDEKLDIILDEQEFSQMAKNINQATLKETEYSFIFQEILSQTADSIEVQSLSWQKQPLHFWMSQQPDDFPYMLSELDKLVLPKVLGFRKDFNEKTVITDQWLPHSSIPDARYDHTAIWTGNEMIVWGGYFNGRLNTGIRYNPTIDSWQTTSTNGAPSARDNHTAIWSGSEMIVWGGSPSTNSGGRYSPSNDSWLPITTNGAPSVRNGHTVIWSGDEMIVWGGRANGSYVNDGGRYNPSTDTWKSTNVIGAPLARTKYSAVWSGSDMIVWGGYYGSFVNSGGIYNPVTDSWQTISINGAPSVRQSHIALWTGNEMIIWGGVDDGSYALYTGGRYNPLSNSWEAMSYQGNTTGLEPGTFSAVWTDSEMIIWGGVYQTTSYYRNIGWRYNPMTDSWQSTTTFGAPSKRKSHSAIWTGSDMIVWGGFPYTEEIGIYTLTTRYQISGTLTGLSGNEVVLQNNTGDDLRLNSDGNFTFSSPLDDGENYAVTVLTQPTNPNQNCTVTGGANGDGTGIVSSDDVSDIVVTCTTIQYDVNVSVNGLAGGSVTLSNGVDTIDITTNSTQTISILDDGSSYNINITNQPDTSPNQTCSFTSPASGTLNGSDVTVNIECATTQYNVNISVSGLSGGTVSYSNGADFLDISADGTQTISTLDDGSAFDVDITAQPINPYHVCSFTNPNSGVLNGSDVIIAVECVINQYDVEIELTGLATGNNISFSNGADTLTMTANGTQSISTLEDGSSFNVDITSSQPVSPNQTCSFTSPRSGNLNGSDVTVSVECITNQYSVGGNLTGLEVGNSLVVQNNFTDNLMLLTNGDFSFSTPIDDLNQYSISVLTHPTTPNQTCDVFQATGIVNGNSIDNIDIVCSINTYFLGGSVSGLLNGNDLLLNNGGNFKFIEQNGAYIFNTPVPDESDYDIEIYLQPSSPIQPCQVMNGASTISGEDVTNIDVICEAGNDLIFRNGFSQ